MARKTTGNTSTKRKDHPSSPQPSSEQPKRKSRKLSDDSALVECSSYPSVIFNIDVSSLMNNNMTCREVKLFYNVRKLRDDLIKNILKEYENSLMMNNFNNINNNDDDEQVIGTRVQTYGKMNIKDNVQSKRNQCKVFTECEIVEMYLCVNSEEFKAHSDDQDNEEVFMFDKWLVYRCDPMKTTDPEKTGYKVFQTKSTMIGNRTDTKSFHWLGITESYCSIRRLDCTVNEVRVESKGNAQKETVELSTIKEQIRIAYQSSLLSIIPRCVALERGIPAVTEWGINLNQLGGNAIEPAEPQTEIQLDFTNINRQVGTNSTHSTSLVQSQNNCLTNIPLDALPVAPTQDRRWESSCQVDSVAPLKKKGFDGNELFQNVLNSFGIKLVTETQPTISEIKEKAQPCNSPNPFRFFDEIV